MNNLNEEEKKAIEILKNMDIDWHGVTSCNKCSYVDDEHRCFDDINGDCQMVAIKTILNLIEKQQEQLQEKDKIIELMGEDIQSWRFDNSTTGKVATIEAIIEYFTKKAREV